MPQIVSKGRRHFLAKGASVFYIFSFRCSNGSHYTGISSNVAERLSSTNDGRGPEATRDHLPVSLAFTIGPFPDHNAAKIVSLRILPEISHRYQSLLRGDAAPVQPFGVEVKFGEEALSIEAESLSNQRSPRRYGHSPSKDGKMAGIALDLALSDPAELAGFLVDFTGPRDGDFILRGLLTDESLSSIGARHGRSRERVRQVMAKFGVRLRRAFANSELATRLCQQCRVPGGELSPRDLAAAVRRVLGWRPERASLALLMALIEVADPAVKFSSKLRVAPEQRVPLVEKAGELTAEDALELIRQLTGEPESDHRSSDT
ncbi:MAG: hypothetical protein U0931_25330 [Vulcanimicrobiota bacterium]